MSVTPFVHELIGASAGSGKTHQLTNRYLRLLATGVDLDEMLSTTFTRKAAAEILDRVLERLANAASDAKEAEDLASQIDSRKTKQSDFVALLRRMLQSLHRIRIGTLDSFYIALASSFSLELGLPAGWSICEQPDDDSLRAQALELLLEEQPDDIVKLLPLLTKGEMKRSVHEGLLDVIGEHYESYRSSDRNAWECLQVPAQVADAKRITALDQLRAFDLTVCHDKRFVTARDEDIANFEQGDWIRFVGKGLAAKVLAGVMVYQRKEIPPTARELYEVLIRHARAEILKRVADQTRATWDLLDRFNKQLQMLKQASGALRFGEVTQAIVDGLRQQSPKQQWLGPEALAFRLDGAIRHLLLDEFQDTSLLQWRVLEPIARHITKGKNEPPRTFFCVGDVKQAIYGWRGGMAEIFNTLKHTLGNLEERPLLESRRSAQPVIDVVNMVFGNLTVFQPDEKYQPGLEAWSRRFEKHTTVKANVPGYVCLHTGPAQIDGDSLATHRGQHCRFVAEKIRDLVQKSPGCSIGVLCRKNDTVARLIYELREAKVEASEEGGNPLTDSPAVELMLSLFTIADHPGHSIAWFHLQNSPLKDRLASFHNANVLAANLRQDILTNGYGPFTQTWAVRLAPACDRRDLRRMQQLVEIAYGYQPRATLRTDDFVAWVREKHVPDPSDVSVRVMTIHAAKGLQFDIVVLPELDAGLTGQPPPFIVGHEPKSLDVNFVCRYAPENVQMLLEPEQRRAFEEDRQHRIEESLSLLYVAMTRAKHALHLYIPGERKGRSKRKDAWYNLLMQMLAPEKSWDESALLFQHGDETWFQPENAEPPAQPSPGPQPPPQITFRTQGSERRRGLEHVAPSRREGEARVVLNRLFNPSEGTGTARGRLFHAWFATIRWLDDGMPTDEAFRATVEKMRFDLPPQIWLELDQLLAKFKMWLQKPVISEILRRSAYANAQQEAFPSAFRPFWNNLVEPQEVEPERPFVVHDGMTFLNGSLDRVVWLGDGDRTVAADVIDFKTDDIEPGDEAALDERKKHYRPQMEIYRRAVVGMSRLPPERVATRLVFTSAARVVDV
jgi:ATP-dependent helicase/nuclease subunit A